MGWLVMVSVEREEGREGLEGELILIERMMNLDVSFRGKGRPRTGSRIDEREEVRVWVLCDGCCVSGSYQASTDDNYIQFWGRFGRSHHGWIMVVLCSKR